MDPVFIAIFTVGALSNIYTVLRCFQSSRVWRNLGWFTPFAAFLLSLNIGTFGALLFLAKSQDSVPRNLTAACVAGPTVAFFSVSMLIFSHTALVTIKFLGRVHRWRFSTKQVVLIMAMIVFASGLLLSPAIRAAVEETPVITTKKCVETARFDNNVINVKMYVWWVLFLQFYIPGIISMTVVSRLVMVRIRDAKVSTCQSKTHAYTTIANLLMWFTIAPFAVLGGLLLWEFEFFSYTNEVEVQYYILMDSQLIVLTFLIAMDLLCLIELEISDVVSRQAEPSGRLIEDKAACCVQSVNENTDTQNV